MSWQKEDEPKEDHWSVTAKDMLVNFAKQIELPDRWGSKCDLSRPITEYLPNNIQSKFFQDVTDWSN